MSGSRASRQKVTDRQVEILRLVALGMTNGEVAKQLWLAEDTVKTHMRRAFAALGVRSRTQAVMEMHRRGLLDDPDPYTGPERRTGRGRRRGDGRGTHPAPSRP